MASVFDTSNSVMTPEMPAVYAVAPNALVAVSYWKVSQGGVQKTHITKLKANATAETKTFLLLGQLSGFSGSSINII